MMTQAKNRFREAINPPDLLSQPLKTFTSLIEIPTNKGGGGCWDLGRVKRLEML